MRFLRVASIVFLVGVFAFVLYIGWERNGPNQFQAAFNPGGKIVLDLTAGGYKIIGTKENQIRVEVNSGDAAQAHCHMTLGAGEAKIRIEGSSDDFRATVYIPERSDLTVDQTIGDLEISNLEGNTALALDIGRIHIDVPDPPPTFEGAVLLGGLRASNWHVDKGGFFRSYYVKSPGPYTIKAQVDIGDLETSQTPANVGDSGSGKSPDQEEEP